MKNKYLLLFILLTVAILSGREKTEKIGDYIWFTEQNSFEKIVQISQKVNKPILAVFSTTWCPPCRYVKKHVFKHPDFSKVKEKAVLLYIDDSTIEGRSYNNNKFSVNAYPTFKIFAKDGVLLNSNSTPRTVQEFLNWIDQVYSGHNYLKFLEKIKNDPSNRDLLIKIVDNMSDVDDEKKIKYLKKALKIEFDFNNLRTQKVAEKIIHLIIKLIPDGGVKSKDKYLKSHRDLVEKIIRFYYPEKFKYNMKGDFGLKQILTWYNKGKQYRNVVRVFNDFIKLKKKKLDISSDIMILQMAFEALLNVGKVETADMWLNRIVEFSENREKETIPRSFNYYYLGCYPSFIKYFAERNDIKKAEKYAKIYYELLEKMKNKRSLDYHSLNYALKYGIFAKKIISKIEAKNKNLKGERLGRSIILISKIFYKTNEKKRSIKILFDLYNNKKFLKSVEDIERARILNSIAWAFVEIKSVNKTALKIARESVELNANKYNQGTLRTILTELGDL